MQISDTSLIERSGVAALRTFVARCSLVALSRVAVTRPSKMLRSARMAAMRKLRRGIRHVGQRRLWAVHVGRGEIVWQDRCDAANGSKEPRVTVPAGI